MIPKKNNFPQASFRSDRCSGTIWLRFKQTVKLQLRSPVKKVLLTTTAFSVQ